jgi:hypothetical protein
VRLNLDTMQKSPLPDPWGVGSVANAVLSSGVAVGTVKNPQGLDSAAFWDEQGQWFGLPGPLPSVATDVNDSWTVAGSLKPPSGAWQPTRWWAGATEPQTLPVTTNSYGPGIDNMQRVWFTTPHLELFVWMADGVLILVAPGSVVEYGFPGENAEFCTVGPPERHG